MSKKQNRDVSTQTITIEPTPVTIVEPAKKKNSTLIALCVVLVAAVILIAVLLGQNASYRDQKENLTSELQSATEEKARLSQENTDLLDELIELEDQLYEAQQVIEESAEKQVKLQADIDALQVKVTELRKTVSTMSADQKAALREIYLAKCALNRVEPDPDVLAAISGEAANEAVATPTDLAAEEAAAEAATATDLPNAE